MNTLAHLNTRILVIDDEQVVRDTFCEILSKKNTSDAVMNNAAAALFDEPVTSDHRNENLIDYRVDIAINGQDAFEKVKESLKQNDRYALIFCDMRMPGWDGLTTVQQIRTIDTQAEIVFVTAYSDHSAEDITKAAGPHVGYHCKPFEADEIRQIATKGICDWNKLRDLENLIQITSDLNLDNDDLNTLLRNILQQITNITDNRTALLLVHKESPSVLISIGDRKKNGEEIINNLVAGNKLHTEIQTDDYLYLPMSTYGVLIMKDDKDAVIDDGKIYIIRLFIQQASKAIDNANLSQELAKQKRLSDLGQAASCIVHDLKQPLNIIVGALTIANRKIDNPDRLEKLLKMISNASTDLNEYILDILEFSKEDTIEKSTVNIKSLLEQILEEYEISHADHNVKYIILDSIDQTANIDKNQIRRVIKNLINNATDALEKSDTNEPQISLSTTHENNQISITVSDNGPGIPEDIHETLFEAFVTKGKSSGTGLGLAISKKFVDLHEGEISFNSSTSGTTFKVSLPLNE